MCGVQPCVVLVVVSGPLSGSDVHGVRPLQAAAVTEALGRPRLLLPIPGNVNKSDDNMGIDWMASCTYQSVEYASIHWLYTVYSVFTIQPEAFIMLLVHIFLTHPLLPDHPRPEVHPQRQRPPPRPEAVQPAAELELRPAHLRLRLVARRRPRARPHGHAYGVCRHKVVQGAGGHAERKG